MSNRRLVTILFFLVLLEPNARMGRGGSLSAGAENKCEVSVTLQLVQVGEDPIHINSLHPALLGKNSCLH